MRETPKVFVALLIATLVSVQAAKAQERTSSDRLVEARKLALEIDLMMTARWDEAGIIPASIADDEEFLRRIYLDIAGRIPSSFETRSYLANEDPQKRFKVADELLDSSRYVTHFSRYWRKSLLPEARTIFQRIGIANNFRELGASAVVGKHQIQRLRPTHCCRTNRNSRCVFDGKGLASRILFVQGKHARGVCCGYGSIISWRSP